MDGHVPDGGLWLVSGLLRDDVSLWSPGRVPFLKYVVWWLWVFGMGVEVPINHGDHVVFRHAPVSIGQPTYLDVDGLDRVRGPLTRLLKGEEREEASLLLEAC